MAQEQFVARAPRRPWLLRALGGFLLLETAILIIIGGVLSRRLAGFIVAGVLALALVVLLVPLSGRSLAARLRSRWEFLRRSPNPVAAGLPVDLQPLAEWMPELTVTRTVAGVDRSHEIGIVTDGRAWTSILALSGDDDLIATGFAELDLEALSGLALQDDVVFAGVQVVTYTVPAPTTVLLGASSAAADSYRETVAAIPPAVRRTWLGVRLDPRLCLEAVARRGAGTEGIHATLRFGLHRVQSALKRQGIETHALSSVEVADVLALTSGAGPEHGNQRSAEGWSTWTCDHLVHSGCSVRRWGANASIGYQALLDAVTASAVLFAVSSFTVSTGGVTGGLRLACVDEAGAAAAVASVQRALQARGVRLGHPGGAQVPLLLGTVPLGREVEA